ncbi:MAG: bifunctional UDP-sugar hydrolase/5'-nucleotidase [Bacteroidota bacterium]
MKNARWTKSIVITACFFAYGFWIAEAPSQAPEPRLASLTILHWNDFHSQNVPFKVVIRDSIEGRDSVYYVGGTATLLGYIHQLKANREDVAVLNAGDDFQGTSISSITKGRSQIELMNIIDPDAMTLGNHEFDYGLQNLENDLSLAHFPILNANIFDERSGRNFQEPYLVKTFGNVRVGIIGLIAPDLPILTMRETLKGLRMLNHIQVTRKYIAELKKQQVNLIIVLSHIGVDADKALADSVPDIDVIVGGHSHTSLFQPIKRRHTIICQAGTRGRWIGELDLTVDLAGDSVFQYDGKLVETVVGKVTPDPIAAAKVNELESSVDKELNQVIGMLGVDWQAEYNHESNIGNWATDVMRAFAETDIGFANSGGFRKDLRAGDITVRDIWEIFPFNNDFVTFRVDGKMLRTMISWQADGKGELMQVSGLRYTFDSSKPAGQKVLSIEVNGNPVDNDKIYSVVTNNYVGGHLHDLFGIPERETEISRLDKIDHDLFVDAVKKQKHISSRVEGRIVDVAKQ